MIVSISIVSYNTRDLLRRCLKSIIQKTKDLSFEVIVVDNGSSDGSWQMVEKDFPKVILIRNDRNEFFTKANNQALNISKGKYFILLNSDTYFEDNAIKKIVAFFEKNPRVGAIEGLELYENRRQIPNGSRFSTPLIDFYELSFIGKRISDKHLLDAYRLRYENRRETFPIDVGCDAFLAVRKDVWRKINGYDEQFLLYYTENDLCKRIKQKGYEIIHLGSAHVVHSVSASADKLRFKKMYIYYKDMLRYYLKYGYIVSGILLYLLLQCELFLLQMLRPKMFERAT